MEEREPTVTDAELTSGMSQVTRVISERRCPAHTSPSPLHCSASRNPQPAGTKARMLSDSREQIPRDPCKDPALRGDYLSVSLSQLCSRFVPMLTASRITAAALSCPVSLHAAQPAEEQLPHQIPGGGIGLYPVCSNKPLGRVGSGFQLSLPPTPD